MSELKQVIITGAQPLIKLILLENEVEEVKTRNNTLRTRKQTIKLLLI